MSAKFSDPSCIYCGGIDTEEHFIRSCPLRKEIWQTIINRFLINHSTLTFATIARPSLSDPSIITHRSHSSFSI
jgi:hypothetical protein